jgi:hypothetical protein
MTLLKLQVSPRGSLTQAEAEDYLGGSEPLRVLVEQWGLRPWHAKATRIRYRVEAIEEAMRRAEHALAAASSDQSTAAECVEER